MKPLAAVDKKNILIYILLLITVAAVAVTVWALFFREPDVRLAPDYAPVETERHARPIPDDCEQSAQAQPGSGSVSLTYSNEVFVDLGNASVELLFANPGRSNQDMVLQIVIRDQVILQSGRIEPGNQIAQLDLGADGAAMLSPGGYEGCFRVFYYDPVSGEKAIVSTEIPISVTVTERGSG